jgi:hypothetical protein
MPIKPYWSQVEPAKDGELWRFMDLRKFRDLMGNEELYFRRADLYPDQSEGLPPEAYALRVLGLDPYDINDRFTITLASTLKPAKHFTSAAGISIQ